ncbi:hypothetical protein L9F63_001279 [Diploptera punctata]|uniref:Uncharacterized protein n=1 Tax=Diploptera punctata TaxID=6984 RepID=A0AAD8A680_DIPPU|nr:hypothetical protein L9F63_001279 [Diploptera punctata]
MGSWKAALSCLVVLVSLALAQDEQPNDSLRTAIEAVSRRQRDLAAAGPNYYTGSLSQYRYQDSDTEPVDGLAFLATPREFTGDGQPENIGYGYQKTIASPSGMFSPQAPLDGEGPINSEHATKNKMMEKMLVEYLEDELKGEPEEEDEDDDVFYHKRSAFRERADEQRRRLQSMKKREFRSFGPSAFRERTHTSSLVDDVEEKKRKILADALVRKMEEQEEEERRDRERGRVDDDDNEEEYLDVLRNVWDKYRKDNPHILDIEDISEGDVGEILNYLGNTGLLDDEDVEGIKQEANKRNYDFNTHNMAMGGFGGHGFKKRWNQRLDGDENQKGSFLYSLKFVSPAINREAIESLKDDDDLELPDERDEDVLRLTSNVRREPDPWFPAFERGEAPEELFGNPSEEEYQRLVLAQQNEHQVPSRKRMSSLRSHYRESSPPDVFLTPEKKYLYDTAIMKKRIPRY